MSAEIKACSGCGASIEWDSLANPEPITEHCTKCPPWVCETCGGLDSLIDGGPACDCWVSVDGMALADVKALFAADGTFNIGTGGEMTVAEGAGRV